MVFTEAEIALAALLVTVLASAFGITWKVSAITAQMTQGLKQLGASVEKLEEGLVQLSKLPLIEQRVEQLEHVVKSDLAARVSTLWDKIFSLQTKIAVQGVKLSEERKDP